MKTEKQTKTADGAARRRVVLVGTYKGDQLKDWPGWYCWPLDKGQCCQCENVASAQSQLPIKAVGKLETGNIGNGNTSTLATLHSVTELWLYRGTADERRYRAEFVGVKTREELIRDYGYPGGDVSATKNAKDANGGSRLSRPPKPHGTHYALFKTELLYRHKNDLPGEADAVIVRLKDFAKRSQKVAAQLKAYLESPERHDPDLAKRLPSIITKLPPELLRMCEGAVQMSFWDIPEMEFSAPSIRGTIARKSHGMPKPFVKWAGGKGQLLEQLDALLPADFSSRTDMVYVEPFVGGGAMLFHILCKYPNIQRAVINDLNHDLATCYRVIKDRPDELISILREFQSQYTMLGSEEKRKSLFLAKRDLYNLRTTDDVETTALFIFLNRTCFNGLYRVNVNGKYNVPFGKAVNPLICDEATIRADSEILGKVEILSGDFEQVAETISAPAFFYFDPPYRPLTQTAAFTAYSKDGFGDDQQVRLSQFARRLSGEGYRWLLSNSDPHNVDATDNFFDDLFSDFIVRRVSASRMINSKADGRGKITELAITNYKG